MKKGESDSRITTHILLILSLNLLISFNVLSETRDFHFEKSNVFYTELEKKISPRIQEALNNEDYFLAAKLNEKLLSDYPSAIKNLKIFLEKQNPSKKNYKYIQAAFLLPSLYAHTGEFEEAEESLTAALKISERSSWETNTKETIDLTRRLLPLLQEKIKDYKEDPHGDHYRDIVEIYRELGEYGHALSCIKYMQKHYSEHPWLKTESNRYFLEFLTSYIQSKTPLRENLPKVNLVKKKNPEIDTLFQELHRNVKDRLKFCQKKWNAMSTIERAKLINSIWAQAPSMGFQWEPSEKEAIEFLRNHKAKWKQSNRQISIEERNSYFYLDGNVDWDTVMSGNVLLSQEENAVFQEKESEIIQKIAQLKEEAIPDLLATFQEASTDTPAGYEARWSKRALGQIGKPALPFIKSELNDISLKNKEMSDIKSRWNHLVESIMRMKDSSTIPMLRELISTQGKEKSEMVGGISNNQPLSSDSTAIFRSFSGEYSQIEMVLIALDRLEGGLTEDILLNLWKKGSYNVIKLLGKYGTEKTIKVLEGDLSSSYAQVAYDIENAIWEIKNRLKLSPGSQPTPLAAYKGDPDSSWVGVEKSLTSSNPGIRLKAVNLYRYHTDIENLDVIWSMALQDSNPKVKDAAWEVIFQSLLSLKTSPSMEEQQVVVDYIPKIMETFKTNEPLRWLYLAKLRSLIKEDNPYYLTLCEWSIQGIISENTIYYKNGLYLFKYLFFSHEDLLKRYVTQEVRLKMEPRIMQSLDSDDMWIRGSALSAVQILGLKEAKGKIHQIALGDTSHLRKLAIESLSKIGDKTSISVLSQIVQNDPYIDQWLLYPYRELALQVINEIQNKEQ